MEICIEIRGPFSFLRNSLTNLNSSRHRRLRRALRPFYIQISNFQTFEVIAGRGHAGPIIRGLMRGLYQNEHVWAE